MWGVEVKDILGWLVTGGLGVAGLVLGILNRRDQRRAAKQGAEAIWTLRSSAYGSPDVGVARLMAIDLHDPQINRVTLLAIRTEGPKGARLAHAKYDWGNRGGGKGYEVDGEFTKSLTFDKDLKPNVRIGMNLIEEDVSTVYFFVTISPSRTWTMTPLPSRSGRQNLRISAKVQDISSMRRKKTIRMVSEPIDWAVSKPASTT